MSIGRGWRLFGIVRRDEYCVPGIVCQLLRYDAMAKMTARRKAAFLVGIVAGTPAVIIGTVRAYSQNPTKGWVTGIVGYLLVLIASFATAKWYDGRPRYGDKN